MKKSNRESTARALFSQTISKQTKKKKKRISLFNRSISIRGSTSLCLKRCFLLDEKRLRGRKVTARLWWNKKNASSSFSSFSSEPRFFFRGRGNFNRPPFKEKKVITSNFFVWLAIIRTRKTITSRSNGEERVRFVPLLLLRTGFEISESDFVRCERDHVVAFFDEELERELVLHE